MMSYCTVSIIWSTNLWRNAALPTWENIKRVDWPDLLLLQLNLLSHLLAVDRLVGEQPAQLLYEELHGEAHVIITYVTPSLEEYSDDHHPQQEYQYNQHHLHHACLVSLVERRASKTHNWTSEKVVRKTLDLLLATWGVKFYGWTLLEDILLHIVESVVDGPHYQLILGEGEEVLQDEGGGYRIINWLYYEVAGK